MMAPGAWAALAKCKGMDPALFFPEHDNSPTNRSVQRAKEVCATCPVRLECLDHAVKNRERFGIFGGTTPKERGTTHLRVCPECELVYGVANKPGRPEAYCSPRCKDVARERQKREHFERNSDNPGTMFEKGHGKVSKYHRGCRCSACRRAVAVKRREQRKAS